MPNAELASLLALPLDQFATVDIARLNLLCAEGLPGSSTTISECLKRLDQWALRVKSETARHRHRFARNPAEFELSEGYFRMLILATVLAEDFGVHYHPTRRVDPRISSSSDGFFANSGDVFLHGLLGPQRRGTCSSLPVLYVAVGRRLGYPLKLVTTKGHLFARWEGRMASPARSIPRLSDGRTEGRGRLLTPALSSHEEERVSMGVGESERFNIEATGDGLSRPSDEEYRRWPYAVSAEDEAAEGYLRSLSAPEELAVFLSIRGFCLHDAGRTAEAAESFRAAVRLAPGCRGYQRMLELFESRSPAGAGAVVSPGAGT